MNEIIYKIIFMSLGFGSGLVRMPHMKWYKKTEKIKSKKHQGKNFFVFLQLLE
jgi:hypothetical protein